MNTLCVEGWRFIHHSYAIVNQWQLLSLLKRNDIALSVRDLAFFSEQWRSTKALFSDEEEAKLKSIPVLAADALTGATYRICSPYDFSLLPTGRTVVFGTAEYQYLDAKKFARPFDIKQLSSSDSFYVITPSRWSREGFLRLGLRDEQVIVVPHGVANNIFRFSQPARNKIRQKLKLSGFTFANASAMTGNKGIDILLRAFAVVAQKRPNVHLLLKGADGLYTSKQFLMQVLSALSPEIQHLVASKTLYDGSTLSMDQMAEFYLAADVYVSPYRAEGFNLPVLEASASGIPVICTKGGATDDFLNEKFALFIDSQLKPASSGGLYLEPNLDHLIHLMLQAMDDDPWRRTASAAGVSNASCNFDWDTVVDKMVNVIFDGHTS
jgi:glycosyltransferase involved in cell wall biosynthesis